ncbi:Uncharacterized protein HZ326_3710 [Fusarium oxysporum f. sp. albedinis]|nr:Uncharacterized protein HZ326_3710 [Fusarium oxysporum f. sp. albedinis]
MSKEIKNIDERNRCQGLLIDVCFLMSQLNSIMIIDQLLGHQFALFPEPVGVKCSGIRGPHPNTELPKGGAKTPWSSRIPIPVGLY